jgi:hypothetical protein
MIMTKTTTAKKTANDQSPLELAEATLSALQQKRARLAAKREDDDRELAQISYQAHTGDKDAAERVDAIHARKMKRESEIQSVDFAIAEATKRVQQARAAETQAQAREVVREILKRTDTLVSLAQSLDDANTLRVEASRAIADELMEMRSLAHGVGLHVPSHDQYLAMGARADQTAGMQTPFARDVAEHLPPNQRRTHMSYATQWRDAITKSAAALVGEE